MLFAFHELQCNPEGDDAAHSFVFFRSSMLSSSVVLGGSTSNGDCFMGEFRAIGCATVASSIPSGDLHTPFSASLQKDNFYATQFHPEKSGKVGERILQNFLDL